MNTEKNFDEKEKTHLTTVLLNTIEEKEEFEILDVATANNNYSITSAKLASSDSLVFIYPLTVNNSDFFIYQKI